MIDRVIDRCSEPGYLEMRRDIIKSELSRGDDGFIQLTRKRTQEEWTAEFNKNPWAHGLYWRDGELRLIPKQNHMRDTKGFILLKTKVPDRRRNDEDMERDENGFIKLKRIIPKDKVKLK